MVRREPDNPPHTHGRGRACLLSLGHLVDLDLHHTQVVIARELVAVVELEHQHLPYRYLPHHSASARALQQGRCMLCTMQHRQVVFLKPRILSLGAANNGWSPHIRCWASRGLDEQQRVARLRLSR